MGVGANKPAIPISISTTIGVGIGGLVMVFIMVGLTLILAGISWFWLGLGIPILLVHPLLLGLGLSEICLQRCFQKLFSQKSGTNRLQPGYQFITPDKNTSLKRFNNFADIKLKKQKY